MVLRQSKGRVLRGRVVGLVMDRSESGRGGCNTKRGWSLGEQVATYMCQLNKATAFSTPRDHVIRLEGARMRAGASEMLRCRGHRGGSGYIARAVQ
jgi:hypothetical protein